MSDLLEQTISITEGFPGPEIAASETENSTVLDASLKEVLRGDVDMLVNRHYLYLVRNETVVFYVGQSSQPINRLKEHLGLRRFEESNLGLLIFCNLPESLSWRMQLFTLLGCGDFLRIYLEDMYQRQLQIAQLKGKELPANIIPPTDALELYKLYSEHGTRQHIKLAKNIAEKALISHYKPCLNSSYNYSPAPLPPNIVHPARLQTVPYLHPLPHEFLQVLIHADNPIDQETFRSLIREAWEKERE